MSNYFPEWTKKTSKERKELLCPRLVILDPDWRDRQNYDFSFNKEEIEEKEFWKRIMYSTCENWQILYNKKT